MNKFLKIFIIFIEFVRVEIFKKCTINTIFTDNSALVQINHEYYA